ncbi:hypothetical protein KDA11_06195 [Candidatus Saccharibacteria bacterium]|nr:hypothetical protein [Candidatus Saccharibacteria bacterium]
MKNHGITWGRVPEECAGMTISMVTESDYIDGIHNRPEERTEWDRVLSERSTWYLCPYCSERAERTTNPYPWSSRLVP